MTDQIVRIRIMLDGMDPAIWRRVELPLSNSLKT
ncbi:plasmid pRiA4b ORF-3 family protein, partial [Escherichia coli]|nr:plasmid pRiA4b ORF-3 family protein [Escherichia coli]